MSAIILFDGVCNFCNGSVNFVIRRDAANRFKFAPLQSEIGEKLLREHDIDPAVTDSIVLIENGAAYTHSSAVLRIARGLGGVYRAAYWLVLVPKPLRDFFYRLAARNRYRFFGRQEVCMMPTPEIRARFLETN